MDNTCLMTVDELQQLKVLLSALLRDGAMIESLSLMEKQHLEGARAITHSLVAAHVSRQGESVYEMPQEEK